MGQKTHPVGFRLIVNKAWHSNWYAHKGSFHNELMEDVKIRKYLRHRLPNAGVSQVNITRTSKGVTVLIHTARPGIVIGRGGEEVNRLKKELKQVELESTEKESFIQGVLQKKFMKFGGGFYGVLTFITYLHIEGYQLIQFISSFTADGLGFNGGIFSLIIGFFLEMIMNFITALMWPIYWFKFLPIESFWVWLLVSISAHTWATRFALSRKGSNI